MTIAPTLKLRLPATSANLGPGFDAVGLAMELFLHVEAEAAEAFAIHATGRNADLMSSLERNLIVETYRKLAPKGPALRLNVHNEIPLGMGCGSSAAALLAGVHLANRFGGLEWTSQRVMEAACVLEGHPDNVAACHRGGLTVSSMRDGRVTTATLSGDASWNLLLVLPGSSLATAKARALLPDAYSRADAVENLQATALLVAAFAQGRGELLKEATRDRMHQPYRLGVCPLLGRLLPLAGESGILSVTLSGAGPSVLLIAEGDASTPFVSAKVKEMVDDPGLELVMTKMLQPLEFLS